MAPDSIKTLTRYQVIKAGDAFAKVGMMHSSSMLHFELYEGLEYGRLGDPRNKPYNRLRDLLNPSFLLDSLAQSFVRTSCPVVINSSVWRPEATR